MFKFALIASVILVSAFNSGVTPIANAEENDQILETQENCQGWEAEENDQDWNAEA